MIRKVNESIGDITAHQIENEKKYGTYHPTREMIESAGEAVMVANDCFGEYYYGVPCQDGNTCSVEGDGSGEVVSSPTGITAREAETTVELEGNTLPDPNNPLFQKSDDTYMYDAPKYKEALDLLVAEGYQARFYGTEGYLIPDKLVNPKVRILCRTIYEGFTLNVLGGLFDLSQSEQFMKEYKSAVNLVKRLNEIIKG